MGEKREREETSTYSIPPPCYIQQAASYVQRTYAVYYFSVYTSTIILVETAASTVTLQQQGTWLNPLPGVFLHEVYLFSPFV